MKCDPFGFGNFQKYELTELKIKTADEKLQYSKYLEQKTVDTNQHSDFFQKCFKLATTFPLFNIL